MNHSICIEKQDRFLLARSNLGFSVDAMMFKKKPFFSTGHDILTHIAKWLADDLLPPRTFTILVLRDPLERELSAYFRTCRYGTAGIDWKKWGHDRREEGGGGEKENLGWMGMVTAMDEMKANGTFGNMSSNQDYERCLHHSLRLRTSHNFYTEKLGGSTKAMPSANLQLALDHVRKASFVALTECYDTAVVWLARTFGWTLESSTYIPIRVQQRRRLDRLKLEFPGLFDAVEPHYILVTAPYLLQYTQIGRASC